MSSAGAGNADVSMNASTPLCRALLAVALAVLCLAGCSSDESSPPPPTAGPTALPPTPTLAPTSTFTQTSTRTITGTPTSTPTPLVGEGGFTISGSISGVARGFTMILQPLGRTVTSDHDSGAYAFEHVPPGDYLIHVEDGCGITPCIPDENVTVVDADVVVDLTYDWCPMPALVPSSGPPGTAGGFGGHCYFLHSGRSGGVFFDDVLVGTAGPGDTPGNYGANFVVPLDATVGPHTITVKSAPGNPAVLLFTAGVFTVTEQ